ncbi:sigma-E factor negative regulatory protein [Gilvimarinus xylanilyticus]|uniref:Sigma-E factor negative regulatory protein n=1 Tax=Gilvimarinus xylanilyticus TaxID=2944139 RepID=A0A9X2I4B3_9GAMM|nr:sigma-E factor negative regulatory protein [Gilvimarinus xylanilyticus]MCP8899197.1 sigma-E factor negative regulatory protein [Gilvimarinus xylanilyticus]
MTDKFEEQLAESVSAAVDNQASELELARVLKSSGSNRAVRETWSRYQLASAAMRKELPEQMAPTGFADSISSALEQEPPLRASAGQSKWLLGLGRAAVAASVAGAVIIGAQLYQQDSLEAGAMVADAGASSGAAGATTASADQHAPVDVSLPVGFNAPALSARPVSAQSGYQTVPRRQVVVEPRRADVQIPAEQVRVYLQQLLEQHTDQAAINGVSGMAPHARVPLIDEE